MNPFLSQFEKSQNFFKTGATRDLEFTRSSLLKLLWQIRKHESEIEKALFQDLGKSQAESFVGELALIYDEIKFALKHLRRWRRPKRVLTPWVQWPARSFVISEPKGVVLIIGPWNYPFQLVMAPLVGAIAAGCVAVIKPSEHAPRTTEVVKKVIREAFDEGHIAVVEAEGENASLLCDLPWDHLFFTGGTSIGVEVMKVAAKHLTPVTLELGGKSPCIVDTGCNWETTFKRITWGKFFNAGQTCVAPDYLMVPKGKSQEAVESIRANLIHFFGTHPDESDDFGRIINTRHWARLKKLVEPKKVALGGESDEATRYLAPTILTGVTDSDPVMQGEIFGPVLPILEYDTLENALAFVRKGAKPLALYFFSGDTDHQKKVLQDVSFGGGCINDTLVHLTNPRLPFGGVGQSGMGAYHGKESFDAFTHRKSILKRYFFLDNPLRYPPYAKTFPWVKKLLG